MAKRKIERIGLIGVGKHGSRYAKHIVYDFDDLELAAITRRDPERLRADAARLGVAAYPSAQALIDGARVDALIAVVPPYLHLDIVRAAAAAGLPLLLEKPAAPSLDIGRAMLAALAAKPVPVMVAQTLRYNGAVRAMRVLCAELGEITSLTLSQRFEPSPLQWLDDPERSGGGIVLHTGVHSFDLLWHLTGCELEAVTAQVTRNRTRHTEDNCAATVALAGGRMLATVSLARTAGGRVGTIEVAGEQATLVADHIQNRLHVVRGREVEEVALSAGTPTVREVVRDFVASLRAGEAMPISLRDGLRAVAAVDACRRAAETGTRVRVEALPPEVASP
jgi:predicted dehydrogenase